MTSEFSLFRLLRRLWGHLLPRRKVQGSFLLGLMVVASFAEVLTIGAVLPFLGVLVSPEKVFNLDWVRPFAEAFSLESPGDLVLPVTVLFIAAALTSSTVRLTLLWANTRFSYALGADLSISIYRRTLYQPYSTHVGRNSSEVIAAISKKAYSVIDFTVIPVLNLATTGLMLISVLAALVAVSPVVALTAFGSFAVMYGIILLATRKLLATDSQRLNREWSNVFKVLQEGLGGIRDVLVDGAQEVYCRIYRTADLKLRRAQGNIQIISQSPRFGMEAFGMVLIASLALALSKQAGGLAGAVPILGALALGAQRLLPVLQQAYSSWCMLGGGKASLQDALDLLDQPLPEYLLGPPPEPMPFREAIRLENLSFRYSGEAPLILDSVNLVIPKGSRCGFVGETGCGKTTLLDIVMCLLQPTGGTLRVDDQEITPLTARAWQVHIAHVPQTIFLADTTIEENIAFGVPPNAIDHERVRQAAREAQIGETIESWRDGYKTMVGERGLRLSGGQRQRIGIARALYKRADVLIFDEATSALDDDTERAVIDAINNLGPDLTVLMIAHRLSTLENCDQIVQLTNGKAAPRRNPGAGTPEPNRQENPAHG